MNPALVIKATSIDELQQKLAERPNYYVEAMCHFGCFIVCILREEKAVNVMPPPPSVTVGSGGTVTVSGTGTPTVTQPKKQKR